jgi:hypothetical protein
MSEANGWFYEVGGERRGPVSLVELKRLAQTNTIDRTTRVWAEGMPEPMPAGSLSMLYPPAPDAAMRFILPIGRSGLAIAAGSAALLAMIPFLGAIALLLAGLAIRDLRRHPEKLGWGRVVFALVFATPFTLLWFWLFLRRV